jgi:hypothetical protein
MIIQSIGTKKCNCVCIFVSQEKKDIFSVKKSGSVFHNMKD